MKQSLVSKKDITHFRNLVWRHYKAHGRHTLPWRKTKNPYRILVSEVMLQQTQVERARPFYTRFIQAFPTVEKLAKASLKDVLTHWQGLGYNRRAKMLQNAAQDISRARKGIFPTSVTELEALPGIGPYTARAIAAFAFNQDVIVIETNIRTAVLHHFFQEKKNIEDTSITQVLIQALPKGKAREWYSALMDYGWYLKQSGISCNKQSSTYTKQSRFSGSLREARGAIVRALLKKELTKRQLVSMLGSKREQQATKALQALKREQILLFKDNKYYLSD